jgi:hypothetical protein
MCHKIQERGQRFVIWKGLVESSIHYLLDLSNHDNVSLGSLPTDLMFCESVSEMICLIFRMYSIHSALYQSVNYLLRCFPIDLIGKFQRELGGALRYIYLLQSSIESRSHTQPLSSDIVVYRGLPSKGLKLAALYESMINEMIVWPGFTSTSRSLDYVIDHHKYCQDWILFEIELHRGDIAVDIAEDSAYPSESEILIAASTGFLVVEAGSLTVPSVASGTSGELEIPIVKLSYCHSWFDFDIDRQPKTILL